MRRGAQFERLLGRRSQISPLSSWQPCRWFNGRAPPLTGVRRLVPATPEFRRAEMVPEYYDALEIRDPQARERAHFARAVETVRRAKTAPGWARQLGGFEPHSVASRAGLAQLPLLRKSALPALQQADPPFGGFNVTPPGKARRLMMSPGPIFEPECETPDGYGAARALFACGFRQGDIVHNAFSYHLTPGAFIFESGLHALGCAVIPGGIGNTDQQIDAIAHFKPSGYAGTPDFLKLLLDSAARSLKSAPSLKRALVSGAAFPATLREELAARRHGGERARHR